MILALPLSERERIKAAIEKFKRLPGEAVISVAPIGEALAVRGLCYIGGLPTLEIVGRPIKRWAAIIKWIEDKTLALLGLLISAPLMIIIALLIKWDSCGPVLFVQERLGFNNKVINILKFAWMTGVDCADRTGAMVNGAQGSVVMRVGRVLRATQSLTRFRS